MHPVVCFVTDRRRFGDAWESELVGRVRAAALAGVHLVQVRERDLDGGPLARLTAQCLEAVRGTRARIVVNDRLDVALVAGAHGVHLRGDSIDASRARRIAPPGFLIGRSVHSLDEVLQIGASALDYLIFGTVFETVSKPGVPAAGLSQLAAIARATTLPVLAVGGIASSASAAGVAGAGAAGFAAIGLFSRGPTETLRGVVEEVSWAFDTSQGVP